MIRLRAIGIMVHLTAAKGATKGYAYSRKRSARVILDFPQMTAHDHYGILHTDDFRVE
jgi:hypothetical protein